MRDAVIIGAVRSAVGRRNGSFKDTHPVSMLGDTLNALFEKTGVDPALVDDAIGGCVSQVGEQAYNVTRNAWLNAGLPEQVPATSVDRQCGSSQQAAHFAAQAVLSGSQDLVVACGVENMSRVPMGSSAAGGWPFPQAMMDRYEGNLVPQGISSEMIAAKWGIERSQVDELGLRSQELAQAATREGRFSEQIVPLKVTVGGEQKLVETDEGLREGTTLEKLNSLKPAFYTEELAKRFPDLKWVTTAGNSSQISDGASALLITTSEKARELGVKPLARFHAMSVAADDPVLMLTAVIPATKKVLEKAGLGLQDIDAAEVNEAFASVVLAWKKDLGVDEAWFERVVNPNGGAIALGHPLGASGGRLMVTLVHELHRRGGRWGLQTMCEGGGMANATVLERLD
ncbi:MAG: thiolase family protein [Actinomycetota bacterium]